MSNTQEFFVYKDDDRKQVLRILDNFNNSFQELYNAKQSIRIELKKIKSSPTRKQQKYYFGVVLVYIKKGLYEQGNDHYKTTEDVSLLMKEQLGFYNLRTLYLKKNGKKVKKMEKVYKSLSDDKGDKEEIKNFIDGCIRWAAEYLGISIPSPEEYGLKEEACINSN